MLNKIEFWMKSAVMVVIALIVLSGCESKETQYKKTLEKGFINDYKIVYDLSDPSADYTKGVSILTVMGKPQILSSNIKTSIQYLGIDGFSDAIGLDVSQAGGKAMKKLFLDFSNQSSSTAAGFLLTDGKYNTFFILTDSDFTFPSSGRNQYFVFYEKDASNSVPRKIVAIMTYEEIEENDAILFEFLKPFFDTIEDDFNRQTEKDNNWLF
jgi:hypothetical protein